jgi:hypothetical protein
LDVFPRDDIQVSVGYQYALLQEATEWDGRLDEMGKTDAPCKTGVTR